MAKDEAKKSNLVIYVLVVLLILAIGGFVWAFFNYQKAQERVNYLSNPEVQQELAQKEINEIVSKVKKHIKLPEDVDPAVATIEDVENLSKQQPFFQNAVDGDKLLVYKDKAIIYSVSDDILVNVGPVYVDDEQQPQQVDVEGYNSEQIDKSKQEEQPITLDIRNGSATSGLAGTFSESINKEKYSVVNITDAATREYEGSLVINNSNKDISILLTDFELTQSESLPEGEVESSADFVIILGN